MTARRMAMALGVSVLAAAGLARADENKAVPRGGGGGGSHSSGAADRHPSGGASASSAPSHSSSGSEGYRPAFNRDRSGAELRHPRPGTGTGSRGAYYYGSPYYRGYNRYGYGYGYYPYDRFYGGFYYGYSPYYYSGYYGYSPYYYGSGYRGGYGYGYRTGSLRLLVEPRESRVYVDGYYAGIVDDFDGIFQRLHISPGRHEIMFKLEGFRSYRVRVYVPLDQTVKIHHRMASGSGTEVDETTVGVPMDDERYADRDEGRYEGRDDDRYEGRDDRRDPGRARRDRDDSYGAGDRGDMGSLRLDVEPADASVYVDGDFKGTGRQIRALSLPAGRHRVEIVRPGFRTVERDVEIRPGQTTDLEVNLDR